MREPLVSGRAAARPLAADDRVAPAIVRLQWLKLASGLIALALVAAIRVWRWSG